jgi:hypothetical protein
MPLSTLFLLLGRHDGLCWLRFFLGRWNVQFLHINPSTRQNFDFGLLNDSGLRKGIANDFDFDPEKISASKGRRGDQVKGIGLRAAWPGRGYVLFTGPSLALKTASRMW